jgi:hypothetical protein
MKLHADIHVNGKKYAAGSEMPGKFIFPFFLLHMLMFGGSGFFMAYVSDGPPLLFLYLHGGFAILIYLLFYFAIFGVDEVKWMFINAGLGILGLIAQLDWILERFGKDFNDYSLAQHFIPFLYYVLYTFLLRQALLYFTGAVNNEGRRRLMDNIYVFGSLAVYLYMLYHGKL